MKLNFLVEQQGAKKRISIIDRHGNPCRLVSSVYHKDRFHPRFAKKGNYVHLLSPVFTVGEIDRMLVEIWKRFKSAVPGNAELAVSFMVLEQMETSPSVSQSEQV